MGKIKNLVIVESPAKAKTIEKFLGSDYKVMSSYGHIRDLRKKQFGIDIDNNFEPVYEVPDDKEELVTKLKKESSQAEMVWLASDEDREGEAIAWHLFEVLQLDPARTKRIVFHEITKNAILNAIANPREIDLNLVDAQQARRVLDRIVGFELSPVLWKKIKPSLSAGRVQSVAVRLIVERENEIKDFESEAYYRVTATMSTEDGSKFKADASRRLPDMEAAENMLTACKDSMFEVGDITVRPLKKSPAPPFTTSTLQQEAARKLGFTVSQTMMVAQRLYEAGFITYMRTDSLNLSQLAINSISKLITDTLGKEYLTVRHYHTKSKGAQEAHEAIRPTYPQNETINGTAQEKKLYDLIRKRTIASQMADAEVEKTTVDIVHKGTSEKFTATGETILFPGFFKVYSESTDDPAVTRKTGSDEQVLPHLSEGQSLTSDEIIATERFTMHPPRYTEASLVKKMEELGIGRPSTYAPTISTIQQREYVVKGQNDGEPRVYHQLTLKKGKLTKKEKTEKTDSDKGKLLPTDIGMVVNEFLTRYFPDIMDYNFTAKVEERFDSIAEGELQWNTGISTFYEVFHPEVDKAMNMKLEHKVGERLLGTDPKSGEPVMVKIGRFGPVVQIGDTSEEKRPRFASLRQDQSLSTLTLEEALKLFEFPRNLGMFEDKEVIIGVGKFGPYVKHDGKYVSIPPETSPTELTLDEAIEMIESKREADKKKMLKTFAEDEELKLLNGRYGIYLSYKGSNYKIPKSVSDPTSLTYSEAMDIISTQDNRPRRPARRATGKSKK